MSEEIEFNTNWIEKHESKEKENKDEINVEEPKVKKIKKSQTKPKAIKKVKVVEDKLDEMDEMPIKEVKLTDEKNDINEYDSLIQKIKAKHPEDINQDVNNLYSFSNKRRLFDFNKKEKVNYSYIGYLVGFGVLISFLM